MQATVRTFDPATRAGTVLVDDGVELSYDADALTGTGLRHLRLGQRVQIEVDGSGPTTRVRSLRIYTLRE